MIYFVCATCFIINIKILVLLIKQVFYMKELTYMPYVCSSLGYVINLSGKKGCGKTTTASGIIQNLVLYIKSELNYRMDKIRKNLPKFDFNSLEEEFIKEFEKTDFCQELALKKVTKDIDNKLIFSDGLSIKKVKEMIVSYLEYFYILNYRRKFVLSKTYFFDCINLENAKQLDPTSLELNHLEDNRNVQLDIANVLFIDEKSNGSGNVNSNNKEVKKSGRKEIRSLIRNAYEGLSFEVSTKQVDVDEIAQERRQIDANLNIRKRKVFTPSSFYLKLLKRIYNIFLIPRKIKYFFKPGIEEIDKKKTGFLRNFESYISQIEDVINAEGYIIVYARNYFESDDVGKKDPSLWDKVKLVFPKIYCYASCDTYEWSVLRDYYKKFNNHSVNDSTSYFDKELKVNIWLKDLERGDDSC